MNEVEISSIWWWAEIKQYIVKCSDLLVLSYKCKLLLLLGHILPNAFAVMCVSVAGYNAWPLRAKQLTLCFGIFIIKTKAVVAMSLNFVLKMYILGLLWRLSGKGFACQWRRHQFESWCRKIPHATKQLSPWTTAVTPALWNLGSATAEVHTP